MDGPERHPTDLGRFHLIAPYELHATRWTDMEWFDLYAGSAYRITTNGHYAHPHGAWFLRRIGRRTSPHFWRVGPWVPGTNSTGD